jgi:hypothetical protein
MAYIVQCVLRKRLKKWRREQEGDSMVVWIEKEFAILHTDLDVEGEEGWFVARVHRLRTIDEHDPQYADYEKTKVRRAEFKLTPG